ncbi:hypothetical protein EDM56_13040 [Brevibacillus fluminis]|uniref:Spore coat protein n=1 Tax=Brevibacillus fluminis TaxID=511487 RepID=A0A3M8DIA7_9BACL|nr:TasA family protein [Brevibacillus fluminis]RNB87756.1 hypothetical protein EDM56_13040 [Brevibacillus fluminis]
MSIKAKVSMAILAAAAGLSLVGGGTYASFTDTESAQAEFAAGTIDLQVKKLNGDTLATNLFASKLSNLKPGDSVEKLFKITNGGTLSIRDVFLKATYTEGDFVDGADPRSETFAKLDTKAKIKNTADEFADQIVVEVFGGDIYPYKSVWKGTLKELNQDAVTTGDLTDPTIGHSLPALPWADADPVRVRLTFKDTADNKFQGDALQKINFQLIATQHLGTNFVDGENIEWFNGSQLDAPKPR